MYRLSAMGWPFPPTLTGLIESLPDDIVPLWQSRNFWGQVHGWAASTAPLDIPLWAALALVLGSGAAAKSWSEKALWRLGAALWALVSIFFFINDPHNRFIYASAVLLPGLFALAALRLKRPLALAAAAAASLAVWHVLIPPQYATDDILGLAEARFLSDRLGPQDILVALSDPDWVFSYAFGRHARVLKIARSGDGPQRFGAEAAMPGTDLERRLDEVVCGGNRALFAADALFRSSGRDSTELDAEARKIFDRFSRRYIVAPAWVSPRGQHYFPLLARNCPRPVVH